MANYAFNINPIPPVLFGHTFTGDNFMQLRPYTKILDGVSGLKFVKCNLINCDLPPDAVFEGCRPHHMEFCTNLMPKLVDRGLTACAENCVHVISTDKITVDGVVLDTVYHYEHRRVD